MPEREGARGRRARQSEIARLRAENADLRREIEGLRGALQFVGRLQKSLAMSERRHDEWRRRNPIVLGGGRAI